MEYKTLTQETIRYEADLKIPAVTICNLNRIQKNSATDPRDRAILRTLYLQEPNFTTLREYPGEEYVRNFSLRQAIVDGAYTVNETFLACVHPWKDTIQTCSPFPQFSADDYCYTVNAKVGNDTVPLTTWYQDLMYGIYMILYTNQESHYLSYAMSAGFKVFW